MKKCFKILWQNVLNFIEFAFFILAVASLGIWMFSKLRLDSEVLDLFLVPTIALLFVLFTAFKKRYVVFSTKNHFQNILSIVFLILSLLWLKKCMEGGLSLALMSVMRR